MAPILPCPSLRAQLGFLLFWAGPGAGPGTPRREAAPALTLFHEATSQRAPRPWGWAPRGQTPGRGASQPPGVGDRPRGDPGTGRLVARAAPWDGAFDGSRVLRWLTRLAHRQKRQEPTPHSRGSRGLQEPWWTEAWRQRAAGGEALSLLPANGRCPAAPGSLAGSSWGPARGAAVTRARRRLSPDPGGPLRTSAAH